MEIDPPGAPERLLVAFEDRTEYRKERLRPPRVPVGTSPSGDVGEGQPAALEVLQEGRHQAHERTDPALFFENVEHFLARDWRQGHAVGRELLGQVAEQPAVGVFMAEGLDQDGAVCGMDLAHVDARMNGPIQSISRGIGDKVLLSVRVAPYGAVLPAASCFRRCRP